MAQLSVLKTLCSRHPEPGIIHYVFLFSSALFSLTSLISIVHILAFLEIYVRQSIWRCQKLLLSENNLKLLLKISIEKTKNNWNKIDAKLAKKIHESPFHFIIECEFWHLYLVFLWILCVAWDCSQWYYN